MKISIQPKIKHFLWRVLSISLATSTRLISRGMAIVPICPHCRNSDETINHVLFTCPFTTLVWRLSHSPIFRTQIPSDDLEENLSKVLDPQSTQLDFSTFDHYLPLWLLWRIWKSRNTFVFNKYRESASKTVIKAKAEVKEWLVSHNVTPVSRRNRFLSDINIYVWGRIVTPVSQKRL